MTLNNLCAIMLPVGSIIAHTLPKNTRLRKLQTLKSAETLK